MVVAKILATGFALAATTCFVADAAAGAANSVQPGSPEPGYWLIGGDGGVFAFNAPFEGSGAPGAEASSPGLCPFTFGPTINVNAASLANSGNVISYSNCVGIAGSSASSGYWIANFSSLPSAFGAAADPGQLGCSGLNGALGGWIGIAATPSGHGFFLVGQNGGVLGCGDATPLGGVTSLSSVVIGGIAATPDGKGYWLVGSDGGVFAFGDATFFGSMGGQKLDREITGIAANPDGPGYWLVAADGGVFAFGGAPFRGSLGGTRLNASIVGIAAAPN